MRKIYLYIKKGLPNFLYRIVWLIKNYSDINKCNEKYNSKIIEIRNSNKPIRVIFLIIMESVWKYESLYRLMENDEKFEPLILICPQISLNADVKIRNQIDRIYDNLSSKRYNIKKSYKDNDYIDLTELNPDIIMFTNPYEHITLEKYSIHSIKNNDFLTCYTSYFYPKGIKNYHRILSIFESRLWINFVVSKDELKNIIYRRNCFISGYPLFDRFNSNSDSKTDCISWKIKDNKIKKIIYAPYHMLQSNKMGVQVSTFLKYSDFMLELASKFSDKIQIAFKPHPLLRIALENHPDWGKEKTDSYYDKWSNNKNTSYVSGDYIDLFNTSDAIIHDCGSFLIEYLYEKKSALYLTDGNHLYNIGKVGREAFDCYQIATNKEDIENFVIEVIQGTDTRLVKKESYYNKYLLPPNNLSVSENMFNYIKTKLGIL